MSNTGKKWRTFYLFIMIFIYAIYVPVTFYEWIWRDGGIPYTAFLLGIGMPLIRMNHLRDICKKEEGSNT